jgi:hypothetical protein
MSETIETKAKRLCLQVVKKKKWRPFETLSVRPLEGNLFPFSAFINMQTREITVHMADDLEEQWAIIQSSDTDKVDFDDMLKTVCYSLIVHEHGHHTICPSSSENFQAIISGIYEAVKGNEVRKETIHSILGTVHNMFSDTVLNAVNSNKDPQKELYKKGLCYLYRMNSHYVQRSSKKKFFKQKIDKAMTLFLSQNFLFCGVEDEDSRPIRRYFPSIFLGYERYLSKLTSVFTGDEKSARALLEGDRKLMPQCLRNIEDRHQWKKMAYDYTLVIYRLLRGSYPQLRNSYTSGSGNQSGSSSGSRSDAPLDSQGQQMSDPEKKSGSPKKEKKSVGQKKKGKKSDSQGKQKDPITELLEEYEKIPPHVPLSSKVLLDFDTLDELYKKRAGKIVLESDHHSRSFPIHEQPTGSERISIEEFDHKNIDWGSTRIRHGGRGKQIDIFKRSDAIALDFSSTHESNKGLPDLAFILDSSSSMEFSPFKGDGGGQYHYAVLAFYSILRDLEEKNLAQFLRYKAINFSWSTITSPWCEYMDIESVKKTLFDYQGAATVLDPNHLKELRESRYDECLVFMLSDTCFNSRLNQEEVFEEVKGMIQDPSLEFYLFQLNTDSEFSMRVRKEGGSVQVIKNGKDFLNQSMKMTEDRYEIST